MNTNTNTSGYLLITDHVLLKYGKWSNNAIKCINTLRPRQEGRRFPDIFKWIFLNEII